MLPSERLRLNASKSESLPVRGDAAGVPPEGGPRQRPRTPFLPWGAGPTPPTPPAARRGREPRRNPNRRLERDARSLADDLGMDRGVVPSRAAASLRSAETKPFDPRDLPAPQTGESFGRPAGAGDGRRGREVAEAAGPADRGARDGPRPTGPARWEEKTGQVRRRAPQQASGSGRARAGPGPRGGPAGERARECGRSVGRSAGREMGQVRRPAPQQASESGRAGGGAGPARGIRGDRHGRWGKGVRSAATGCPPGRGHPDQLCSGRAAEPAKRRVPTPGPQGDFEGKPEGAELPTRSHISRRWSRLGPGAPARAVPGVRARPAGQRAPGPGPPSSAPPAHPRPLFCLPLRRFRAAESARSNRSRLGMCLPKCKPPEEVPSPGLPTRHRFFSRTAEPVPGGARRGASRGAVTRRPKYGKCPESGQGRPASGRQDRARRPARRRPTRSLFFASRCADSGPPKAHVSIGPVSAFASPGMVHLL